MTLPSQPASFWRVTTAESHFPQLIADIAVDVAVVGGGITGMTAALLLARAGLKVAVIEAGKIGTGTTGHSSGHLRDVPPAGCQQLIASAGAENASLAVQSCRAAIELLAAFIQEEGISCHFQRVPAYLYTESREDLSYLEDEMEAARGLGIDATLTANLPLPFPVRAGILFPAQAQFHPAQYLHGLAEAFARSGGLIFERTRVLDIRDSQPCRIYTERGSAKAQNIILATGTPIHDWFHLPDLLGVAAKIAPYRSYLLAVRRVEKRFGPTAPLPAGLFWDTANPSHHTRSYTDSSGEVLIAGGENHKTGHETDTEACYRRLEEYVRVRYEVESVTCKWSAQFYEPADGLPFIGKPNSHEHLYIATGYSGNLSFGTAAAVLLADLIQGKPNPWRELYDPNRVPIAGATRLVAENLDVAARFIADRFVSEASSLSEVGAGQGKIVDMNGEKVAVYRDMTGAIYALSPVCAHSGCIVHWNSAEKSWDCPCHGGRYSPTGRVIDGPPINGLTPKKISPP